MDWDETTDDFSEDDYYPQDNYRSNRSPRVNDDFDEEDEYFSPQRPAQTKKNARPAEEPTSARSEGTFSGAGKGPLYDAYNQLHTLAQVCTFWS